jgi:hypothetical protein
MRYDRANPIHQKHGFPSLHFCGRGNYDPAKQADFFHRSVAGRRSLNSIYYAFFQINDRPDAGPLFHFCLYFLW